MFSPSIFAPGPWKEMYIALHFHLPQQQCLGDVCKELPYHCTVSSLTNIRWCAQPLRLIWSAQTTLLQVLDFLGFHLNAHPRPRFLSQCSPSTSFTFVPGRSSCRSLLCTLLIYVCSCNTAQPIHPTPAQCLAEFLHILINLYREIYVDIGACYVREGST